MRSIRWFIAGCALLLCHLNASAQATDMRFFIGTWEFRIWGPTNTTDKPDLTGTWKLESGLDSALALTGHVILNDGPGVQGGGFTRELIGYDAQSKLFTRTIVTNAGGHYVFTSAGWQGEHLTWNGEQHSAAGSTELREEIDRTGPDSFMAVFYRKDGEQWMLQSNEKLDRVPR
jgi:hypothetical protein